MRQSCRFPSIQVSEFSFEKKIESQTLSLLQAASTKHFSACFSCLLILIVKQNLVLFVVGLLLSVYSPVCADANVCAHLGYSLSYEHTH